MKSKRNNYSGYLGAVNHNSACDAGRAMADNRNVGQGNLLCKEFLSTLTLFPLSSLLRSLNGLGNKINSSLR